MRFRTGTKVGRTLYLRIGDRETLVGMLDSPELAELVASALNDEVMTYSAQHVNRFGYRIVGQAITDRFHMADQYEEVEPHD